MARQAKIALPLDIDAARVAELLAEYNVKQKPADIDRTVPGSSSDYSCPARLSLSTARSDPE